ncbi:alpha/beta fold hydrolase [Microbacterium sp. P05]|uniref:alpha/beta fold hydrolase n=1 Tax=Microbacterium sp. P05 TaxID=3366948 RepID=UPI003745153D
MPALVLVHGHPETSAIWGPLMPYLNRSPLIPVSPPGFGSVRPNGFKAEMGDYRDWLIQLLEEFREPVDLLGHDWGGVHVINLVLARPDLVNSWIVDDIGLFDPEYDWHPVAKEWQDSVSGRAALRDRFEGTFDQRLGHATSLGMSGEVAERIAAGMGAELSGAAFDLYRSGAQPALRVIGQELEKAATRPGLVLRPMLDRTTGTEQMVRRAAHRAGATVVDLPDAGHWWMLDGPQTAAVAINEFRRR